MTEIEQYVAPSSLEQAAEYLQRSGEVTILAGGTDLMPQSQGGRLKIKRTLMNIQHIPELKGIAIDGGAIRIGALATITEIMQSELIKKHLPILIEACDHFASDQIRNAATLGGNVCNASPAGDMLVPLLVLDAEVELASKPDGRLTRRRLPLSEFFVGPGKTRRAPSELLAGLRIGLPGAHHYARFFKFGTRPAHRASAGGEAPRRGNHRGCRRRGARRGDADRRRPRQRLVPQGTDPQHHQKDARPCRSSMTSNSN